LTIFRNYFPYLINSYFAYTKYKEATISKDFDVASR